MDPPPYPRERPPMAWPAYFLGLLSVGFLTWSLMLPWTVPVISSRGSPWAPPILGVQLPVGRILIATIAVCILVWIARHTIAERPPIRWWLQAGSLGLFAAVTVWVITWHRTHAGHASPGVVWGCALGLTALSLAGWAPIVVTRSREPAPTADRAAHRRWTIHGGPLAVLLLGTLLILSISGLVAHELRQPVVVLTNPCACSDSWPP